MRWVYAAASPRHSGPANEIWPVEDPGVAIVADLVRDQALELVGVLREQLSTGGIEGEVVELVWIVMAVIEDNVVVGEQ
jgi:hypothetical protein